MVTRIIGAAALALLVAACMPTDDWTPVEAPKANKVALERLQHTVRFEAGSSRITGAEATRLAAFLNDSDIAAGERVYLPDPRGSQVAQAREQAVRKILVRKGVEVGTRLVAAPAGRPDDMVIELERYVVTPPDCPNWSKPTGGDPNNTVGSNWGCANATNLGLMVANPRDLLAGRQPGPGTADVQSRGVANYRSGKPIILPSDLSSTGTPTGGAPAAPAAAPAAAPGGDASGG